MKTILKVIHDKEKGIYSPDSKHYMGGVDTKQIFLFRHLIPGGECSDMFEDILFDLAEAHGWEVQVSKAENKD